MKAAYYEENGAAADVLRIGEVETPEPGPGEVRVKIAASGVNPSDVKSRAGTARKIAFDRVIPHSDGAGTIDMVGDGVSPSRLGERVWIWNGQWKRPFGTAAEYIVLPEVMAVRLPDDTGFEVGACLGIPAMTAVHAISLASASPQTTILVSGGAGAVANYVIQFAKARGARVLTTVSSAQKAAMAKEAGADETIDYTREDVGTRVMDLTMQMGVDSIIEMDLTANAGLIPKAIKPKGQVVIYGTGPDATIPAAFCLVNTIRLQFFLVYELDEAERQEAVDEINARLAAGTLVHHLGPEFGLDDIVTAHEAMEAAKIGKIVVRP
ncbi:NADPH:quinone reductase [Microbaculum marinisediminis]|uniref:NADPH:quinone reductase n=1 Tax=Microbaculum marinisediminis TaxID=2931392 RepID=A0AAW5QYL9_9HYPH|nr:NADPH:quinone reductase [Microbaculum sp. A6E488]MCT8973146.1 NADPH:quinone reductase [Microbaculum sp. A6E488]